MDENVHLKAQESSQSDNHNKGIKLIQFDQARVAHLSNRK